VGKARIRDQWIPPPKGFIKLNFDNASKGNPRPAGAEGIFQDHNGVMLMAYASNLGLTMNNSMKLVSLL
jgi:ribonuclease HI